MPLRILHVTPYFADAWAYGGIPRLAQSLCRGLARRGHDVTVCTTDACEEFARLQSAPRERKRGQPWSHRTPDGVTLRIFPNISNRLAYRLQLFLPLGLQRYLRHYAGTFDVAHLHACRNVPGAVAAHYLARARVPYVLAPNGTAPRIERRLLLKRAFDLAAGRRVLGGAARVLAVSNAERLQFRTLGIDEHSVRMLPNPVDLDEFAEPPAAGLFRHRFAVAGPVVLFLGKLTPRKRVDLLVRAHAGLRHAEATLVIAGNDMGTGRQVRALVRALGLTNRTVFTGLLRGHERAQALGDADVVVYPSEHEIFGLVPLESLLSGTPVVVADDSGCGEIIGRCGGGLVTPAGDAGALSDAIDTILDDRVRWRAAAARAAVHVRRSYGAAVVSAQLENLYRELVPNA